MYKPIDPADIREGQRFFVKLKPGVLGHGNPFPVSGSLNTFGPCQFLEWVPTGNRVRYTDPDGNDAHAETDACDFFVFAEEHPPLTAEAQAGTFATPFLKRDDAPFIEWTSPAPHPWEILISRGIVVHGGPEWHGALLEFQKSVTNENTGYLVRVRMANGTQFLSYQQSSVPPDFQTVRRLAKAWQAGREYGGEEGRQAVMDAVVHAGKIIMPFIEAFRKARP